MLLQAKSMKQVENRDDSTGFQVQGLVSGGFRYRDTLKLVILTRTKSSQSLPIPERVGDYFCDFNFFCEKVVEFL